MKEAWAATRPGDEEAATVAQKERPSRARRMSPAERGDMEDGSWRVPSDAGATLRGRWCRGHAGTKQLWLRKTGPESADTARLQPRWDELRSLARLHRP